MDWSKVTNYLDDKLYEDLLGADWLNNPSEEISQMADLIEKKIEEPMRQALCEIVGHKVVMDQCRIPEHDYCMICQNQFKGQAEERKTK